MYNVTWSDFEHGPMECEQNSIEHYLDVQFSIQTVCDSSHELIKSQKTKQTSWKFHLN